MAKSAFVFEGGEGISIGEHGETSFVFQGGTPVGNGGRSTLVFEAGIGLGGAKGLYEGFEDGFGKFDVGDDNGVETSSKFSSQKDRSLRIFDKDAATKATSDQPISSGQFHEFDLYFDGGGGGQDFNWFFCVPDVSMISGQTGPEEGYNFKLDGAGGSGPVELKNRKTGDIIASTSGTEVTNEWGTVRIEHYTDGEIVVESPWGDLSGTDPNYDEGDFAVSQWGTSPDFYVDNIQIGAI